MKHRTVIILFILAFLCIVVGAGLLIHAFVFKTPNGQLSERTLQLGDKMITVEIADTMFTRMRGLSSRSSLPADHGMLFLFSKKGSYSFWMKDTLIPLDLVWISDGKVVGVTANVPTQIGASLTQLVTYPPPEDVDEVLEINAGESAKLGIATSTPVTLGPAVQ